MFDFVEKNRVLVKIVLALIALSLVVGFGLSGYSAFNEPYLAKVGSAKVTERELAEATGGESITEEQRLQILNQLIQRQLILNEAEGLHFAVSDAVLDYVISNIPSFMENGKFSQQRYQSVLASQKKTTQQYKNVLAREIRIQQLLQPLVESRVVSRTMLHKLAALLLEKREISVASFLPQATIAQVSVSEEEVKKYYDQHQAIFHLPQQVRVEYLVLAQEALVPSVHVSEEEIMQYQANNKNTAQEERQARHILFTVAKEADAKRKAEIKVQAEKILQLVKRDPTQFAALARANSQDPGSAKQGGALGFFKRGVMVPAFEKTVFSLKQGEISNLVETPFGYHIIQVENIRTPSQEISREDTLATLKKQKARQQFLLTQERLAEALPMAKDLKSVAAKFQLGVQTSDWLSQAAASVPALNHDKVRAAFFSDEVLNKQYNTELIEIQPGVIIAGRVIEKKPAVQQTQAQAHSVIIMKLKEEKAVKLAQDIGKKTLADLKAGKVTDLAWSPRQIIDRLTPSEHGNTVRDIFKISNLPGYVGVEAPYGYVIYRVAKVMPLTEEDKAAQKNIVMSLLQFYGQVDATSYLKSLQKKNKIEVLAAAATAQ